MEQGIVVDLVQLPVHRDVLARGMRVQGWKECIQAAGGEPAFMPEVCACATVNFRAGDGAVQW